MTNEELLELTRKMGTLTAAAYAQLAQRDGRVMTPGMEATFLAVHHHADLMMRHRDNYRHTTATDVALLLRRDRTTVSPHLAKLAEQGWLTRIKLDDRNHVGYRPTVRAAECLS